MSNAVRRSILYFILMLSLGLEMAVIGPTLPSLAGQTGSTIGGIGMAFLLSAVGSTLGTLLGGWLFGWAPGRVVLGVAQLCCAAIFFLAPHVPLYALLMGLFVLKGVAVGTVNFGVNTLLLWAHGKDVAPFMNAMHFCFGLGAFLSPFLLGLLLKAGGTYVEAFHWLSLLDAVIAVAVLASLRAPKPVPPQPRQDAAKAGASIAPVVISAALFLLFYVSGEITFGGWIYTYALRQQLADEAGAAFLNSSFWLAFTVGRLISIPLAIRMSPRTVIPIALVGAGLFTGLLVLAPGSSKVLWITAVGSGVCMAPVWPTGYTLAGRSLRLTARVSGLILLGDSFGGMILPGLTGRIIEHAGPPAMPRLVLGSLIMTFLAYLGIRTFGRRPQAVPGHP